MKKLEKKMSYEEALEYCSKKNCRLPQKDEIQSDVPFWIDSTIKVVENGVVPAKIVETSIGIVNINNLLNVYVIKK